MVAAMDVNQKIQSLREEVRALANTEQAVRERIEQLKRLVEEKKAREAKLAQAQAEEEALLVELGLK